MAKLFGQFRFLAGALALALLLAWHPRMPWWIPAALFVATIAANPHLFALFRRRGGIGFAVAGLAFHQVYYLYSGAVFVYCWFEKQVNRIRLPVG